MEKICKEINVEYVLHKVNTSNGADYREAYHTEEMKNKVSGLYKKDIELFEYEF